MSQLYLSFPPRILILCELFVALDAVPWRVSAFITASGPMQGFKIISEM